MSKVFIAIEGEGFLEERVVTLQDLGFASPSHWKIATDREKSDSVSEFFAKIGIPVWDYDAYGVAYNLVEPDPKELSVLLFDYETGKMTNITTVREDELLSCDFISQDCDDQTVLVFKGN